MKKILALTFLLTIFLSVSSYAFFKKFEDKVPPDECKKNIESAVKILLSDDFLNNKTEEEQFSFLKDYQLLTGKCSNFYKKEYISECLFRANIFQKSCFSQIPEKGITVLFYRYTPFEHNFIPLFRETFGDLLTFKYVQGPIKFEEFEKKAEKKEYEKPFCYTKFKEGIYTLSCPKWHLEKGFGEKTKEHEIRKKIWEKMKSETITKEELDRLRVVELIYYYKAAREMIEWFDKEFGERGRGIIKRTKNE